jgi:nicotinamidase-related amidase
MLRHESIIDLQRYRGVPAEPLLVLVDLQREFVADGRLLQIHTIGEALENCCRLLAHAREQRWPIAHARWVQKGAYFNRSLPFSSWIAGFEPRGTELVYDKPGPSCYSAPDFAAMMDAGVGPYTLVAGLTGTVSCLATLVEGAARHHNLTFVTDASASHACNGCDESSAHQQACFIAAHHAATTTTGEVLSRGMHKSMFDHT